MLILLSTFNYVLLVTACSNVAKQKNKKTTVILNLKESKNLSKSITAIFPKGAGLIGRFVSRNQ